MSVCVSCLSDDLIGTLDEDLHGPPVVISHAVQKPLEERKRTIVEERDVDE